MSIKQRLRAEDPPPADEETKGKAEDDEPEEDMEDEEKPSAKGKKARAKKAKAEDEAPDEDAEDDDPKPDAAAAADIVEMCDAAGMAHMAAAMIRAGLSRKAAKARIEQAAEINALVAAARRVNPSIGSSLAAEFQKNGASLGEVRAALFDRLVASQSPDIRNSHQPGRQASGQPAHQPAADHGWGTIVARLPGAKKE